MVKLPISVILVSYHTGPVLWRSIESAVAQAAEVVVVNNGNPEDITKRLEADTRIRVVSGHGNVGFAAACNMGVAQATQPYILLLNPDCILQRDTLAKTLNELQIHSDAWVAGCKIVSPEGEEQGTCHRNLITPLSVFIESFNIHRLLPKKYKKCRLNWYPVDADKPSYVPVISGAFMLMSKYRYSEVGGMDEGYFLHVEDTDFCLQIQEEGGRIVYVPSAEVVHYKSTSNVTSAFVERCKARSFIRYFHKNFRHSSELGILPILYVMILVRAGVKICSSVLRKCLSSQRRLGSSAMFVNDSEHTNERSLRSPVDNWIPAFAGMTKAELCQHIVTRYTTKTPMPIETIGPVMITGTSSQIGLCVLGHLVAANIPTIAVYHREVMDVESRSLQWIYGDLSRTLDLQDYLPDTLIHTAPLWLLPPHIEALAKAGVKRIIAFGSTSVFGKADSVNRYEQDVVEKLNQAEQDIGLICNRLDIEWTVLRPTMVYGVGLDKNVSSIERFIERFGFFPVYQKAEGLRSPVHADDLAIAALSIIDNPITYRRRYNLGGGENLSYYSMIERIAEKLGKKPRVIAIPGLPLLLRIAGIITRRKSLTPGIAHRMNQNLVFDDSEARGDFTYNPRGFW